MEQRTTAVGHSMESGCTLYLCAPVSALVEGIYEEPVSIAELARHGDFGLGTFNDLDGEMVMLDGRTYQITDRGKVNRIADETLTPFACVTFFQALTWDVIEHEMEYSDFERAILGLLPSPNLCYAIRIEGTFAQVKTRSVPRQESYRPLVEVARNQPTFDYYDTKGTLAGFFTPSFLSSLNVPGLHLHFLSSDLRHGGHLLQCKPKCVQVGVQFLRKVELSLPVHLDFLTFDFNRPLDEDMKEAERS